MDNKSKLTDARLFRDEGCYYLHLEYEIENDKEIRKVICPKVSFPIHDSCTIELEWDGRHPFIDIGFGIMMPMNKSDIFFGCYDKDIVRDVYYAEKIIKTKSKKMTVAEIEEALGHKVEIIAEE